MEWKNGKKLSDVNSHAPFDWKGEEDGEEEATRQQQPSVQCGN